MCFGVQPLTPQVESDDDKENVEEEADIPITRK